MNISDSDRKWQAESDARSLAESEVIKADKPRLSAAKKAAQRLATEKQKEAAGMSKVAKRSPTKSKPLFKKNKGGLRK